MYAAQPASTASDSSRKRCKPHRQNLNSNSLLCLSDGTGYPLAFVHYDEKDSNLKRFVTGDFHFHLHQMGCSYVTRQQFACGAAVNDCMNVIINRCYLFFMFSLPNIDAVQNGKYIQDRVLYHTSNACRSDYQPVLIPVRMSDDEQLPHGWRHLTAVTFDIDALESRDNQYAYQQISHWVKQCKEFGRQTEDMPTKQEATVEKEEETTKKKIRKRAGRKRRVCAAKRREKTIELMTSACSVALYLTQRWILVLVFLLLSVDFIRELLVTCDIGLKAKNWDNGRTIWPRAFTTVVLLFLSIPCRFVAGIVSMRCLEGFAHRIKQLGLKAVLQQHDINSIKEYLLKEGLLLQSSQDVTDTEVVKALDTYLRSTDSLFLVFPWIHSGALTLLSICGPFYDEFWHWQPGSSDILASVQLLPQFVNVLTAFVVIGFCHSAASFYQIQNKLLIDIHHAFTQSEKKASPSKGVITAWKKLRGQVENSATSALTVSLIGATLQVLVLLGVAMVEKPGGQEVAAVQYVVHICLFLSECIANCPSRSVKGAGLVLDGIMLLVFLAKSICGYSDTVAFAYGSVRLIEFRLLSYKLFYALCLHTRLINVSRDWQYQTETERPGSVRVLNCVMTFWVVCFVIDCFPIFPLIKHFAHRFVVVTLDIILYL